MRCVRHHHRHRAVDGCRLHARHRRGAAVCRIPAQVDQGQDAGAVRIGLLRRRLRAVRMRSGIRTGAGRSNHPGHRHRHCAADHVCRDHARVPAVHDRCRQRCGRSGDHVRAGDRPDPVRHSDRRVLLACDLRAVRRCGARCHCVHRGLLRHPARRSTSYPSSHR